MENIETPKTIKRLNATLPDKLGRFVGEITGQGGLYETPSEFVRDLIRRYMENTNNIERQEITAMITQSIDENNYAPWTSQDMQDIRNIIEE